MRRDTAFRASWRNWRWRPIHLAIVSGVESMAGGGGPWIRGMRAVKPGVMIAGSNPVCTDAVATTVMDYNPARHAGPRASATRTIPSCRAEAVGSTNLKLKRIEVRGVPIEQALYRYDV